MKGLGQRKSGNVRPGFEGGQTPLIKRIPKLKGFKNYNKILYQVINLSDLEKASSNNINMETLLKDKIIRKNNVPVKILSDGDVKKKFTFSAKELKFSKTAKDKIIKVGGKIE